MSLSTSSLIFFFFNDTATTEIYTLSLHDALPIFTDDGFVVLASEAGVLDIDPAKVVRKGRLRPGRIFLVDTARGRIVEEDRKSTRLNSSHLVISYAVFCLKKKKKHKVSDCRINRY